MKKAEIIILILIPSLIFGDLKEEFELFKAKYDKVYSSKEENDYRFKIFSENTKMINERNANSSLSYTLKMNEFGDLGREDFRKLENREIEEIEEMEAKGSVFTEEVASEGFIIDWQKRGKVSPVKDQFGCGSCYAFCAISAVESLYAIKYKKRIQFSEQQILDCTRDYGNKGCIGGTMTQSFQYIIENGISTASSYPYVRYEKQCRPNLKQIPAKINGFGVVDPFNNDDMLARLMHQPLSICLFAGDSFLNYTGGIFDDPEPPPECNHCGLLVGAGTENGIPFWRIKNSWGTQWGEAGYIRILRETGIKRGIILLNLHASYPLI
jgi:hypothetical protein